MSVTTSQQLINYYKAFGSIDVTFTKDVVKATMLHPKQVYLKCLGYQWPCIIYSSSMVGAKLLANVNSPIKQVAAQAKNVVSLRYAFIQREKSEPLAFFVNGKITGFEPYNLNNPQLNFINLSFANKPPDDLILRLGQLLDATSASKNRKDERIPMTPQNVELLGLDVKNAQMIIANVPRRCVLRDVSFSGCKVVLMGVAKFLVNKKGFLRMVHKDSDEVYTIPSNVVRFEQIEGRPDLATFGVQFEENKVPLGWNMLINSFFKKRKALGLDRNLSEEQ